MHQEGWTDCSRPWVTDVKQSGDRISYIDTFCTERKHPRKTQNSLCRNLMLSARSVKPGETVTNTTLTILILHEWDRAGFRKASTQRLYDFKAFSRFFLNKDCQVLCNSQVLFGKIHRGTCANLAQKAGRTATTRYDLFCEEASFGGKTFRWNPRTLETAHRT